jgi:hypothetical protein
MLQTLKGRTAVSALPLLFQLWPSSQKKKKMNVLVEGLFLIIFGHLLCTVHFLCTLTPLSQLLLTVLIEAWLRSLKPSGEGLEE